MTSLELIKSRKKEILELADKYGVCNVRIFGSVARGEANGNSDIDILVDFKGKTSLFQLGGLWMELNDLLKVRTEVFTSGLLKENVKENALREAIAL